MFYVNAELVKKKKRKIKKTSSRGFVPASVSAAVSDERHWATRADADCCKQMISEKHIPARCRAASKYA